MKLSIIIPVYKVEQYIEQCLGSILNDETQGLPFEVIVVNDGTPDGSMAIVDKFASAYANIKILNQENQGLSSARNNGLDLTAGEYVWFVDSDDWLSEGAVSEVIEMIATHSGVDVLSHPIVWKHASGDVVDWEENKFTISGIAYLKQGVYCTPIQRFIFRREFLESSGVSFFPGIYHEDVLYSNLILYLARDVYYSGKPLYQYRQNVESVMHSIKIKNAYDMITVHKQLMAFLQDGHIQEADRVWWQKRALLVLEESFSHAWLLRGTEDYNRYVVDTKEYRESQCNACGELGDWRWKIKCWLLKHPVLNKYRRELIFKLKRKTE